MVAYSWTLILKNALTEEYEPKTPSIRCACANMKKISPRRKHNQNHCSVLEMATQEIIQALIKSRNARVKEASEARDVDAFMKWQAPDTTFTDKGASHFSLLRGVLHAHFEIPVAHCYQ